MRVTHRPLTGCRHRWMLTAAQPRAATGKTNSGRRLPTVVEPDQMRDAQIVSLSSCRRSADPPPWQAPLPTLHVRLDKGQYADLTSAAIGPHSLYVYCRLYKHSFDHLAIIPTELGLATNTVKDDTLACQVKPHRSACAVAFLSYGVVSLFFFASNPLWISLFVD